MSAASATAVRAQAREAYRDSVAAGAVLSGKAFGERFGRSARWGRERIAESRPAEPSGGATVGGGPDDAVEATGAAATRQPAAAAAAAAPAAGARFVAWLGFLFGAVMSVAANVLHTWLPAVHEPPGWAPGIAPQIGSAVISYSHLHDVLTAWQYGPLGAAVGPLVLDGLMVVSGFALLTMSRRPEHNGRHRQAAAAADDVADRGRL